MTKLLYAFYMSTTFSLQVNVTGLYARVGGRLRGLRLPTVGCNPRTRSRLYMPMNVTSLKVFAEERPLPAKQKAVHLITPSYVNLV